MITEIFENLFAPNSPEEVASRRPTPMFKIGDRIRLVSGDFNRARHEEGDTFTTIKVNWDSVLEEWEFWFRADRNPKGVLSLSSATFPNFTKYFEKI